MISGDLGGVTGYGHLGHILQKTIIHLMADSETNGLYLTDDYSPINWHRILSTTSSQFYETFT